MKPNFLFMLAAALAWCGPAAAQTGSPRAQEVQAKAVETGVLHDGIVFYRGQTYLIRNARAALVNATLVPEGQVLTADGRRVPLPTDFINDTSPTVQEGLCAIRGQAYLIRNGRMTRVDARLVPEGQVLTADGQRVLLPSDFNGFVRDRAPDGTVLPTPPAQAGPQVLSGQAGVPQAPAIMPQGTERRPMPISLELPRAVTAPAVEEIRVALPLPTNLLPPAPPFKKTP